MSASTPSKRPPWDKRGIEAACTANIIKYLWRYEAKNGIEDVKKARWYLERLLAHLGNVQEAQFGQQNTIDCRSAEQKGFNDPRTVEGVDVSFPTEKHMNFAPEQCGDCGWPKGREGDIHCAHHYAEASHA